MCFNEDNIKSKGTETCASTLHADYIQPNKWIAATVLPEGALILDTYKDGHELIEVESTQVKEEIVLDHHNHLTAKRPKLMSEAAGSGRENSRSESSRSDSCLRMSMKTDFQQSASVSGLFKETRIFPNVC
ncbi:uncharacterized protein LOC117176650 [Belonocnema kinseyi]|uniref:uncharacterized protein LOC117176650 n=1 Tax=Belonocnema kinseyi TaxID=2817044 RepID=UPI00143CE37F|nr:uncharacterized protein LOC117176650 [Belonocnema kinseyi]